MAYFCEGNEFCKQCNGTYIIATVKMHVECKEIELYCCSDRSIKAGYYIKIKTYISCARR